MRDGSKYVAVAPLVGIQAELYSHHKGRWRDSGYDERLFPFPYVDEPTQRNYDLYDAWAARRYPDDSPFWPPINEHGQRVPGVDAHGRPTIPKKGRSGYRPGYRRGVCGAGGDLDRELAKRGTLAGPVATIAVGAKPRPPR